MNLQVWAETALKQKLDLPHWAERIRPDLQGLGPEAALALLIFDRHVPLPGFPEFRIGEGDMEHIVGFLSFADGATVVDPYKFDRAQHLMALTIDESRVLVMGLLGRRQDQLKAYVDGAIASAADNPLSAPAITQLLSVTIHATA